MTIEDAWPTPVFYGVIPPEIVVPDLNWSELNSNDLLNDQNVRSALAQRLISTASLSNEVQPTGIKGLTTEILVGHTFRGPRSLGGRWAVIWFAFLNGASDQEAGNIIIHDPRVAAAMSFLPGSPWSKERAFSIEHGLFLCIPGWVSWSLPRLSIKSALAMITLTCELTLTCQREEGMTACDLDTMGGCCGTGAGGDKVHNR